MGVNFYQMAVDFIGTLPPQYEFLYLLGTVAFIFLSLACIFLPLFYLCKGIYALLRGGF